MRPVSIGRQLMVLVMSVLSVGAMVVVAAAYWLTLAEIDEALDESLRQTALLLADRDLAAAFSASGSLATAAGGDVESTFFAIASRPDGTLLASSQPQLHVRFEPRPGSSKQTIERVAWHVYTVVQSDRVIQVAQPASVREEEAAESASRLLAPLVLLIGLVGVVMLMALRRGIAPLRAMNEALAQRNVASLVPLDERTVPTELAALVRTLNDLLARLAAAFEQQRSFVADAAHELRTPVTALQLQVQILERSDSPEERALALAELAAGSARARRLVEQLLALSRATADRSAHSADESVSLAALAREGVVRWSAQAERMQVDLGALVQEDVIVGGNLAELEILLNNLIDNALRYVGAGGRVDVAVCRLDGKPALRVIDNGPGIAEAERDRVFDRFYRGRNAPVGAPTGGGLGLAIVKAIARRHGASVVMLPAEGERGLEARVVFGSGSRAPAGAGGSGAESDAYGKT